VQGYRPETTRINADDPGAAFFAQRAGFSELQRQRAKALPRLTTAQNNRPMAQKSAPIKQASHC